MLTNADITIFNRFADKTNREIIYVPHYIESVWFYADQKTDVVNGGLVSAEVYKIRIPYVQCEKYLPESEFRDSKDQEDAWTVQKGDFFIRGGWSGDNVHGIDEIKKRACCSVGKVLSYSENFTGSSPHIRIGGGS